MRKSLLAALLLLGCGTGTTDAPQVYDYGGPVLTKPVVVPIFFANDADRPQVESFLGALASSSYWARATSEYGVGPLSVAPSVVVGDAPPASVTWSEIEAWLAARLDGTHPEMPPVAIDHVYTIFYPPQTTVLDGEGNAGCASISGFHGEARAKDGASIVYVALPRCEGQGALSGLDALTSPLSHELVEASTNPLMRTRPAYAAVDAAHMVWNLMPLGEVADMCSYDLRSYQRLVGPYVVQRVWSNASAAAGHDPCVPVLDEAYFVAVPVLEQTLPLAYQGQEVATRGVAVPIGASETLDVRLSSDLAVGDWSVSAAEASPSSQAQLAFAWDRTSGNDGDVLHLTITRLADGPDLGTEIAIYAERESLANAWYAFVGN